MSRYRGPRLKKIRRLGALPGLTSKAARHREPKIFRYPPKTGCLHFLYLNRLKEKQKLRFYYGLTKQQLVKYVRIAAKAKEQAGEVLLQLLEMRLDNILFRLGMASTIPAARQFVNHRHILVNGRIVDIPSYRCKPRDLITVKDEQKSKDMIQNSLDSVRRKKTKLPKKKKLPKSRNLVRRTKKELPNHLTLNRFQYKGLVKKIIDREDVGLTEINELLILESFSRHT